ncbi:tryptophan halogenase family protein [Steroidobacter sp.]|uniref:tryptophan halogenase family protein n=1 Tax=Steroidobacter sp. TaxID=1978227 RepID=UPI001A403F60|nr:tryptophan halogenase family protein [Steroidobacter sp.]MBL8267823.1 tryptophan 7-halogenase [Steroidobacter sp.]
MQPLSKIVVVGGGTSGWLAAAMLRHHLKPELCDIELIESEEIGTIGVGESTVPPFVGLIQRLGIDEQEFIRATEATYKLGIQFVDWHQRSHTYFHPFGAIGKPIGTHDFYQCWLKARTLGDSSSLQDFSPCNVMAENGRFFPPARARNTPIGGANYALHIDAALVARYLRGYSEARGLKRTEGRVTDVHRKDNGFIDHVVLADGRKVHGDFFLDCTGFRALLIDKALGVESNDWSDYLPCDRAIAVRTENHGPLLGYTRATAQKAGWMWRIPLQHRIGQGYVYSSRFCSDSEARSTLLRNLNSGALDEPRVIPFTTGHRKELWKLNCLSVGLAGGFLEPLEATAMHLIARGIDFFLRYFPTRDCDPALIREYNRRMTADYEEVRDFIVLHYSATRRDDSPFWQACQQLPLPDSLRERIELFQSQGAMREGTDELFRASSWQSVFEGMGIRPRTYSPRIDNIDYAQIQDTLRTAKAAIAGMVEHLPTHEQFLSRQFG